MKIARITIAIMAATSSLYGEQVNSGTIASCSNVGLFHVNSTKSTWLEGSRIREVKLTLIKQLKGRAPRDLVVRDSTPEQDALSDPFGRAGHAAVGWYAGGVRGGVDVVVGYGSGLEQTAFVEVGSEYVEDFAFIASMPDRAQWEIVKPRLEQYLATRRGRVHACLSTYIAALMESSGWNENLWNTCVGNNPLKLTSEAQAKMLADLASQVIESDPGMANKSVWVARTNRITNEIIGQVTANEDPLAPGSQLADVLRTLIRRVRFRMTPETLKKVDELLKSDKIHEKDKKSFEHDKQYWKAEKDREGGR